MYVVDLCTCCALFLYAWSMGKVVDKGHLTWDAFALSELPNWPTSTPTNIWSTPTSLVMDALDGQQTSTSMRERVPIPRVNRRSKRPSLSRSMGVGEDKFAVDPSLNDDGFQRIQQQHAEASTSRPSPPNTNCSVGHKSVHEQQPHHPYPNHHSPPHPILGINHYTHPYTPQESPYSLDPPSWSLPSPSSGAFRATEMKNEPGSSGSGAQSPSPPMAPAEAIGRGAVRLPPILQVEKQHVTTTATQAASASRRRNDAIFKCPVPGCGSTFTRRFNLRGG